MLRQGSATTVINALYWCSHNNPISQYPQLNATQCNKVCA